MGRVATSVNHFDRLPEGAWDEIFRRVPHISRLRSRCVCSRWNHFLRLQQHRQHLRSRGQKHYLCLVMATADREQVHCYIFASDETTNSNSSGCTNLPVPLVGVRSLVTFPPGWSPEANAGGVRASCDLVAFFLEGRYWVGNPVHDKWEKVPEPQQFRSLQFDKRRFELVVHRNGRGYQIIQFRMNEWLKPLGALQEYGNWLIEVYCSRTRVWRVGRAPASVVFRELCNFCVFDRTVYFLGWVAADHPPPFPYPDSFGSPRIRELELVEILRYNSVAVWGYHLDTDTLCEVLPEAPYRGVDVEGTPGWKRYPSSMRLHVSKQPGRNPEFSITEIGALVRPSASGGNEIDLTLHRLLLDQQDHVWYVKSSVDVVTELVTGGPQAALVTGDWGVRLVVRILDSSGLELDVLAMATFLPCSCGEVNF